jgi:hypothetical protein
MYSFMDLSGYGLNCLSSVPLSGGASQPIMTSNPAWRRSLHFTRPECRVAELGRQAISESDASMKPREPVGIWKRIAGFFFGGVGGLVLGVVLFLILDVCGVVTGGDRMFSRFAICGASVGAVLGFIFPRPLIAVGYILGQLIPGV